jgi:FkbM family methyltransferase
MHALTSLSPAAHQVDAQRTAVASWRAAGLDVRSFNHPTEIAALAPIYDVDFVPVECTEHARFGRHCVPIHVLLQWAAAGDEPVILVNADIELRLARWQLQRIRLLSSGGLCSFIRYNWDGHRDRGVPEPYGFDAFVMAGADAHLFPTSFLSMGQPFWDYWLPHAFAAAGRPLTRVEFPAAFHKDHPRSWSWDAWHACAREFARVTHTPGSDDGLDGSLSMAGRVRESFDRLQRPIREVPLPIGQWVESTFRGSSRKTFLQLGAHCGADTRRLAGIPGVTLHAFEPDPRNDPGTLPNVRVHRAAVCGADGRAEFILSDRGWGSPWTHSSSLKRPKHHLQRYPVTFGPAIEVQTVTLDSFTRDAGLSTVDFIWAEVQGAEGDLARGGTETLRRTRYLYTEYSNEEMYEAQASLDDLLAALPDFRVVELWPEHVLLENTSLRDHGGGAAGT